MRKDFYVYIHTRLDSGAVFYVGKGSRYRAYDKSGRNKFWNRIARKTEWVASIVQQDMCEEDALVMVFSIPLRMLPVGFLA